tara:strand:+ start:1838 stop:2539 length:702 start_codon:yes stop_codon:yes gene_type:complete
MSYFAKTSISALVSGFASYESPLVKSTTAEHTSNPVSWFHHLASVGAGSHSAPTYVLDISSSHLNLSPDSILLNNKGSDAVIVEMWNLVAELAHPSGGITFSSDRIKDETSGSAYFENVRVGDVLFSENAGNATNRKFYLVAEHPTEYPAQVKVSLYGTSMVSQTADDTASFLHLTRNVLTIPSGKFAHIPGGVADVDLQAYTGASAIGAQFNELKFYSKSGTNQLEIFITGT